MKWWEPFHDRRLVQEECLCMSHRHPPLPEQYKDIYFSSGKTDCIYYLNSQICLPCSKTCQKQQQSQSRHLLVPWRSGCELWPLSALEHTGTVHPKDCLRTLSTSDINNIHKNTFNNIHNSKRSHLWNNKCKNNNRPPAWKLTKNILQ